MKYTVETPTWLLIVGIYAVWCLILSLYTYLHPLIWTMLMSPILALFGSMCHELLHGHPSDNQTLNDAIGTPPLSLYPYFYYKWTHLKHHRDENLTLPGIDPESFYVCPKKWAQIQRWQQILAWVNMTLAGRILLGPARSYLTLARQLMTDLNSKDASVKKQWFIFLLSVVFLLMIVVTLFKVPVAMYLLAVYFGHAIISLRSFNEHQTHQDSNHRTVLVESIFALNFIFLYNNLHVVHHRYPGLSWYLILAEYQNNRHNYHQSNGGFYYSGYRTWLQFLFRPIASPIYSESNK